MVSTPQSCAYSHETKRCNLCLAEKVAIITADKTRSLNRRTELVSQCRHQSKFHLCNFPPPISWPYFHTRSNPHQFPLLVPYPLSLTYVLIALFLLSSLHPYSRFLFFHSILFYSILFHSVPSLLSLTPLHPQPFTFLFISAPFSHLSLLSLTPLCTTYLWPYVFGSVIVWWSATLCSPWNSE